MLECATLLLRPWQPDASGLTWRCWIVDPVSTALLGSAVRQRPRWLGWLRRPHIAIHESDDEPLLLTLQHGLGPWPAWTVRDAENHPVGRIRGRRLFDAQGYPLAVLVALDAEGQAVYRGSQADLAVIEREAEAVRLTFRMGEGGNPFVKMVLLAAALVHNQDVLGREERSLSASGGPLAAR